MTTLAATQVLITDDDADGKPGVTGKGRIYLFASFEIQGAVWGLARSMVGTLGAPAAKGTLVEGDIDLGGGLRAYAGSATKIGDIPEWVENNIFKYQIETSCSFVMQPFSNVPPRCQDLDDLK